MKASCSLAGFEVAVQRGQFELLGLNGVGLSTEVFELLLRCLLRSQAVFQKFPEGRAFLVEDRQSLVESIVLLTFDFKLSLFSFSEFDFLVARFPFPENLPILLVDAEKNDPGHRIVPGEGNDGVKFKSVGTGLGFVK